MRKEAEQTVQYVQPVQGLFIASVKFGLVGISVAMKDTEWTVQYVQSDQGLFVAGAKCKDTRTVQDRTC